MRMVLNLYLSTTHRNITLQRLTCWLRQHCVWFMCNDISQVEGISDGEMRRKLSGHNYIYSLKIIILLDKFGNLPRKHYKEASFAKVVYRGINTAFGRASTAVHNSDVFQPIKVIGNNGKSWILDNIKIFIKAIYITASGFLQIMLNSWLHWYIFWIITPQTYNKIMIFFLCQEYHSNNYGIPPFTWLQ